MPKVVIADTSCLIVLSKIQSLELLSKLYTEIVITPVVAFEYSMPLPDWIIIKNHSNPALQKELEKQLDVGEASSIALALELENPLLIVDDLLARKKVISLNLEFTGTLGILARSKKLGIIASVKPLLEKLKNINFRMSPSVEEDILRQCNEL
jgi:predicted nucleic acid-binding protein